jgi:hypothetical protein
MEFKVKAVGAVESKGVQELERELVEKHEEQSGIELNKEPEIPRIDLSAGKKIEEPVVQEVAEEAQPEQYELKEEDVLSYIGKRYNKQINSFDELVSERKEAEEMPEDVAAYFKFKKETGRGIEDFIKLQTDVDAMDSEELLREYFSATNEGLDNEDIETLMDDYRYDEDLDDESVIKKTKIAKKKIVAEAKKFLTAQKEQYRIPLESRSVGMPDEEREQYEAYKQYSQQAKTLEEQDARKREWFQKKTDEVFDSEFKGFEFDLNNKKVRFTPGDAAELKKNQLTPMNFIGKYLDESGLMKDAAGYHRALAIAMNPDRFAKFFYEQGLSDATEGTMKNIKNINMSERRTPEPMQKGGMQVRAAGDQTGRNLKIKSIKKI